MEAEFAEDRRRRRILVIVGGLLAVLAALATYYLATRPAGPGQQPTTQRTIVVAAANIPARTVIDEADVRTESVPDSPALRQVVSDPASIVSGIALITINAGDPITFGMIGTGGGVLPILQPGETVAPDSPAWRAVSVLIPQDRAVGGMITEGDHIDLFATIQIRIYDAEGALSEDALPPEGYYSDYTTKVTWENLEVLAVDNDNSLYMVKVDQHQAEEIAHVQGSGANAFSMSLRPSADTRPLPRGEYGETTNRLIEQYNFPIPQIIDLGDYPQPSPQPSPFL